MDRLKAKFKEDPYFAAFVIVGGILVFTRVVTSTAKMVESSAIAVRATRYVS